MERLRSIAEAMWFITGIMLMSCVMTVALIGVVWIGITANTYIEKHCK